MSGIEKYIDGSPDCMGYVANGNLLKDNFEGKALNFDEEELFFSEKDIAESWINFFVLEGKKQKRIECQVHVHNKRMKQIETDAQTERERVDKNGVYAKIAEREARRIAWIKELKKKDDALKGLGPHYLFTRAERR